MADLNDLEKKLKEVERQIYEALPDIATTVTINAKALIEKNVRDIGFSVQYSGNKIPAWFFLGKELNNTGKSYIAEKIKKDLKETHVQDGAKYYGADYGMTWADLRRAQGLPVDHVNLSYSNKMWAGLGPLNPYWEGTIIRCPLGGNSREVINKFNWQRDRYGDFVSKVLRKQEIDILGKIVLKEVGKVFKNNGF